MNIKITILKKIYALIFSLDQSLREKLEEINLSFARLLLWYIIKLCDIFNQRIINILLTLYGWPIQSIYGLKAHQTAYYVLMHSNKHLMTRHLKKLFQVVLSKEADCIDLITLIDRLLIYRGKRQIFGTEISSLRIDGRHKDFIYPVINLNKVNLRREKYNLSSIESYASDKGAILYYSTDIRNLLTKKFSN